MNSRRLTLFSGCVAGAALLWTWYLLSLQPDPVPARITGPPSDNSEPPDKKAAAWPARGTRVLRERLREPAARWLDSRGRNAYDLIAIWDLCGDQALLEEAARRFPDAPHVCRAMIEANTGDIISVLHWAEQLITLERGGNPGGYYLKAWALFTTGRDAEALTALHAATAIGRLRQAHLRDRSTSLHRAATALGFPPRVAALARIEFLSSQNLDRQIYDRTRNALTRLMEKARAAGDTATVVSLGNITFAVTDAPGAGSAFRTLVSDEIARNALVLSALNQLPDDWHWHNITTGVWRERVEAIAAELARVEILATSARQHLTEVPDKVVVEYCRHFLEDGEAKATTWLLEQAGPASK